VLALSWFRTARARRRHRQLLELVVAPGVEPDTRLLEHPAPVAFCIPGARPLLVLSSGMVAELDGAQVDAVVAHERAHLAEHHHLLLLPFVAWRAALPVLPAADRAHDAVRDLVEMRADDVALESLTGPEPRRTLAAAIVATQRDEVARLQGWLRAWGQSESEPASAPAPATDARVAALAELSGPKLDAAVLDLLIYHQAAAVRLARAETGGGVNREALAFARQVDASRSAQVRQLTAYRDGGSGP
jgi:Zn-dependent protease with chaperone function